MQASSALHTLIARHTAAQAIVKKLGLIAPRTAPGRLRQHGKATISVVTATMGVLRHDG